METVENSERHRTGPASPRYGVFQALCERWKNNCEHLPVLLQNNCFSTVCIVRQFPRPAFDWRHLPIYRMNQTYTYRRQVVIKTGSRSGWPVETNLKNPKPGSKAAPPPQRGPCPLSLSAKLYGPVLAVKGSASPRSAPWTAPGRAWGLAVYEGKGKTATGGESTRTRLHKRAISQRSRSSCQ